MRPSAAHAPGLSGSVVRVSERAARRQRRSVERALSRRRREPDPAVEVEDGG